MPEEDFERVSPEDKHRLEASAASAEQRLQDFVGELRANGYEAAARYVANAASKLFTYVRLRLKTDLVCARASSMIDRMLRELGRRLKKIGHGWTEAGTAKMARIIINRITSAYQWDAYWREKLRLLGKVILVHRGVTVQ